MKDKIYNLFKKNVLNIANKKYPEITIFSSFIF